MLNLHVESNVKSYCSVIILIGTSNLINYKIYKYACSAMFVGWLKQEALQTCKFKLKTWFRYVDDTFVQWQHAQKELKQFLNHINNIHNNIQFTMEKEHNQQIAFLDVLIKPAPGGIFSTAVYRKKTHIDNYLRADSHHCP